MAAHTAGLAKSPKPDKILRDALLLELNRIDESEPELKIKKINKLVAKLVQCGMEGKIDAIKEIFDRVEGRVAIPVEHSGEIEHNHIARLPNPSNDISQWQQIQQRALPTSQ